MNILNTVCYDIRQGIFRKRTLVAAAVPLLQCCTLFSWSDAVGIKPVWIDYIMYLFQGVAPIQRTSISEVIPIPIFWLIIMCSNLLLCVDYPMQDLTHYGLQILYRCGSRRTWYISKCIWNLISSATYFLVIFCVVAAFTIITGGKICIQNTTEISALFCSSFNPIVLSEWEALYIAIVLPFFTSAVTNMLCMVFCLLFSPIVSLLVCISVLVLSIYWKSAWTIGNGAMVIRSELILEDGISANKNLIFLCIILILIITIGERLFFYYNIATPEE